MTFNSYSRENSVENKIKFQGQEHIDDLNLGWVSFKWRNHMPEIGRFFNIDPLSGKYVYNSPFAFSENKVVAHVELEGLEAESAGKIIDMLTSKEEWSELGRGFARLGQKLAEPVVEMSKKITNWVANNQDESENAPTEGITVTVVSSEGGRPHAEHLPQAEDNSKNTTVTEDEVNFFFSVARGGSPGARASGKGGPPFGGQPPATIQPGEAIRGTTEAAVTGVQAAREVYKKISQDVDKGDTVKVVNGNAQIGNNKGYGMRRLTDSTAVLLYRK